MKLTSLNRRECSGFNHIPKEQLGCSLLHSLPALETPRVQKLFRNTSGWKWQLLLRSLAKFQQQPLNTLG